MASKFQIPIAFKSDPRGIKEAEGALAGFSKKLGGIALAIGAAFSVRAIGNFAKEAVLAAEAAGTAQNRLEAIAKATGVFGAETQKVTDRLGEFAKAQELRIGVDDKVIKGVQAQLLSFKQLSTSADTVGGTFDRVTQAAFDMAAAGFGSAEGNAIALGKAFEDPVKGLTALRRSGTVFTEEQQDLIKSLVETGDVAAAQEIILGELESQYGGVAAATADASVKLGLAFDNIKETAGTALLPVFAELVEGLMPVTETIGTALADAFRSLAPVLTQIVGMLPALVNAFIPLIPVLGHLAAIFLELVVQFLPVFLDLFEMLLPIVTELGPIIADVLVMALEALLPIFMALIDALMPVVKALLPVFLDLVVLLSPVVLKLIDAFMPLIMLVLPMLVGLIRTLTPIMLFVANVFSSVLVVAMDLFNARLTQVSGFVSKFADNFRMVFDGIRLFFSGVLNGLIGGFEQFVNTIINGINGLIRGLNRLGVNLPATRFTPAVNFGVNIPTVPTLALPRVALAEGGVVTGPTSALIGEAGPEAVIPLSKMGSMGNTYNITVNAGLGTNGATVGAEIVSLIKRYERSSGPVFASA